MKWPDLEVLHLIAAHGSLAGAGRALGIRHTTVGRRLDALERATGAKLVDRLPRGVSLTAAGRALASLAADVDELMVAADRQLRGERQQIAGTVVVTAPPMIANDIVAPGLAPLLARHPGLVVTLSASSFPLSLMRNESDIALRLGDPTEMSLIARRVGTVRLGLYATPAIAAAPPATWRFVSYGDELAHLPHHRWFADVIGTRAVALSKVVDDNCALIDEKAGVKYGDYARSASKSMKDAASSLDEKSLDDLGNDAKEFVRTSPGVAIGMALAAGYLIGRVLKKG